VFTDGGFVFDLIYKDTPIPRAEYEAKIRSLNGPTVDISLFEARPEEGRS
jgi:hypothetical protein